MESNFVACLSHILAMEGGFSNDPSDRGGATNWGVTAATLAHWRGHAVTADDVWKIQPDEAKAIYHTSYWNTVRGGEIPIGVDLMVFDVSVNSGPGRAIKMLQGALDVTADGVFGPMTMKAVAATKPGDLIGVIVDKRRAFYQGIVDRDASQSKFLRGWLNRVDATLTRARAMTR